MPNNDLCGLCFGYVMDELTPHQAEWFAVHLKRCSHCQSEYEELLDFRQVVEQTLVHERAKSSYSSRRSYTSWAGVAAALVFTVLSAAPQHQALANRLKETAQDLHTGISHQARLISMEARKVMHVHWQVPRTKVVHPASGEDSSSAFRV